jgi:serine/threonine-protein kinase Chk1
MNAMDICSESQVGNWEFANTLGEGAYGEVKLALNNRTQETRAVKIISLNLLNDKTAIQKEVLIHKTLHHENVIKYFQSFQQLDKFYIILEYASGGELFDRIEPDFGMNSDLAHKYFCQLISGVEYLHSKVTFFINKTLSRHRLLRIPLCYFRALCIAMLNQRTYS